MINIYNASEPDQKGKKRITSTQSRPTILSVLPVSLDSIEKLTSSLYFMMVLFLALVSTQVTKSSNCLVTSIAGSVTGDGPTRICPCSIVLTAWLSALPRSYVRGRLLTSETVSAILSFVTTTANLLLATLETVNLFSISEGFAFRSMDQYSSTATV
jgi:hypothetical protein